MAVTKWNVETDPRRVRRLGKFGEELGELQAVVARCLIQGIDEIDPASGKTNRARMIEEIADVQAQMQLTIELFVLPNAAIALRVLEKKEQMAEWEQLCIAPPGPGSF